MGDMTKAYKRLKFANGKPYPKYFLFRKLKYNEKTRIATATIDFINEYGSKNKQGYAYKKFTFRFDDLFENVKIKINHQ